MTAFQTPYMTGIKSLPLNFTAGTRVDVLQTFVLDADFTAASDHLELAILPPDVKIVGAAVECEGITETVNYTLGFLDDDETTVGTELIAATSDATAASALLSKLAAIAASAEDRIIALDLSGDVTGAGTKKINVLLSYQYP